MQRACGKVRARNLFVAKGTRPGWVFSGLHAYMCVPDLSVCAYVHERVQIGTCVQPEQACMCVCVSDQGV